MENPIIVEQYQEILVDDNITEINNKEILEYLPDINNKINTTINNTNNNTEESNTTNKYIYENIDDLDIEEVEIDSEDDDSEDDDSSNQPQPQQIKVVAKSWFSNFISKTKNKKSFNNSNNINSKKSSTLPNIPNFLSSPSSSTTSSSSTSPVTVYPLINSEHNTLPNPHTGSKKKLLSQIISIFSQPNLNHINNSSPNSSGYSSPNISSSCDSNNQSQELLPSLTNSPTQSNNIDFNNNTLIGGDNCNNRGFMDKPNKFRSKQRSSLRIFRRSSDFLGSLKIRSTKSTSSSANSSPIINNENLKFDVTNCNNVGLNDNIGNIIEVGGDSLSNLSTSISCDQLNINYISTKHQRSFLKNKFYSLKKLKRNSSRNNNNNNNINIPNDDELLPNILEQPVYHNNLLPPIHPYTSSGSSTSSTFSTPTTNEPTNQPMSITVSHITSPMLIPVVNNHHPHLTQSLSSSSNTSTPCTPTASNLNLLLNGKYQRHHQSTPQHPVSSLSTGNTTTNKTPWSPSKGKNYLIHSRISAPSSLNPMTTPPPQLHTQTPLLTSSISNPSLPQIGTHHCFNSSKSVPENLNPTNTNSVGSNSSNLNNSNNSTPNTGNCISRTQSSIPQSSSPPLLDESSQTRSRSKSNCENTLTPPPIQRQTSSINKWVTAAAPSSPPPMSYPLSPDQTSPDSCLSPISSMIRIYHVPIDYVIDDCMPLTMISSDDPNMIQQPVSSMPKSISSNITIKFQPQALYNYWTQIITSTTQVREVVENIANKLDRDPSSFKLCCSVNLYDYLEDDKLLSQVRIKKFYLMDDTDEVIIHPNVKNPNLLFIASHSYLLKANSNNNNFSSTSSLSNHLNTNPNNVNCNTTTTTTTTNQSCLLNNNLSMSWSPNCQFLSTSSSSLSPTLSPSYGIGNRFKHKLSTTAGNNMSESGNILLQQINQEEENGETDFYQNLSIQNSNNQNNNNNSNNNNNNNNTNNNSTNNSSNPGVVTVTTTTTTTTMTTTTTTTTTTTSSSSCTLNSSQSRSNISTQLKEKIKILDNYFQHYYRELDNYLAQRKKRMDTLQQVLTESGIKENSIAWQRCWKEHLQKETGYLRSKRSKLGPSDFQKLTAIGKGGFGKVYLARKKDSNEIVTLKVIRKSSYHRANQMTSVSKEKEVMMIPHTNKDHSQWITRLLYSFHDSQYLYLAMEYHCGGDFRSLLNNLTRLNLDDARFYMAEMILAVQSLHKLSYIHRDLKPSNFVVDKLGHLKLIDFGLSKEGFISRNSKYHNALRSINQKDEEKPLPKDSKLLKFNNLLNNHHHNSHHQKYNKKVTYSKVGSPEYMAPEMLEGKGYDQTYDYWSLGCVFFEMLFGDTPFSGTTHEEIFKNIIEWKDILNYQELSEYISPEAIDLLQKLLCEPEKRIHPDEIKQHPYFDGLDWDNIKQMTPPFVPNVQNEIDTSYFECSESIEEDKEDEKDECVEQAREAQATNANGDMTGYPMNGEEDTSIRSMPFGGFNFQRFPSVVDGARAKGLIKSFYVEEKNSTSVSRATSVSSLNSPNGGSCANSPLIQSANGNGSTLKPTTSSNSLIPTPQPNPQIQNTSPNSTPSPTSPKVGPSFPPKTPLLRVSSKGINLNLSSKK